jgi:hypothetical protein
VIIVEIIQAVMRIGSGLPAKHDDAGGREPGSHKDIDIRAADRPCAGSSEVSTGATGSGGVCPGSAMA